MFLIITYFVVTAMFFSLHFCPLGEGWVFYLIEIASNVQCRNCQMIKNGRSNFLNILPTDLYIPVFLCVLYDGQCACRQFFEGRACDRCKSGYFGPTCTMCQCNGDGTQTGNPMDSYS